MEHAELKKKKWSYKQNACGAVECWGWIGVWVQLIDHNVTVNYWAKLWSVLQIKHPAGCLSSYLFFFFFLVKLFAVIYSVIHGLFTVKDNININKSLCIQTWINNFFSNCFCLYHSIFSTISCQASIILKSIILILCYLPIFFRFYICSKDKIRGMQHCNTRRKKKKIQQSDHK